MHEKLRCDNTACEYNIVDQQLCTSRTVYYTQRLCITFKPRQRDPGMAELMQTFNTNCHRDKGKWKGNRVIGVLK